MQRCLITVGCALLLLAGVSSAEAAKRPRLSPSATLTGAKRVMVGDTVALKLRARARRGRRIVRFTLSFGDGTKTRVGRRVPTRPVKHRFTRTGRFTARLTVVDNRRRRGTTILRISVR